MTDEPAAEPAPEAPTLVSTTTLVAAAGVTYRQADYWSRRGLLHVDGMKNAQTTTEWSGKGGSGFTRLHPASEVAVAHAVRVLLGMGLRLPDAFAIARAYVDDGIVQHEVADGVTLVLSFPPPQLPGAETEDPAPETQEEEPCSPPTT